MPEFSFPSLDFKRGMAIAKLIKPETGDFTFRFSESGLTIFAYDSRRYVCSQICPLSSNAPAGFLSDEFYLTVDRTALFDTDLAYTDIKVNEKSLSIRVHGEDQSRKASLKKKSLNSKRPSVPVVKFEGKPTIVGRKDFERLLQQVSCSALIKETKTEEDMRINQVHFYPDSECAVSNARYYGSLVFMSGMKLDLSIISSDIPAIKAFCNKADGSIVHIYQDDKKVYFIDPESKSVFAAGKVASKKPALNIPELDAFETEIRIDQALFTKNLEWAAIVIEGTQRLGVKITKEASEAELYDGNEKISAFPVEFIRGDDIVADFPVRYFLSIVKYLEGKITLRYHHSDVPTILEVSEHVEKVQKVRASHFLQCMRSH